MFRTISFFLLLVLSINVSIGQSFWAPLEETDIESRGDQERAIIPENYLTQSLRLDDMLAYLKDAPTEKYGSERSSNITLDIPMPDGRMISYEMFKSSAMMSEIAKRYPSIQTYVGYAENGNNIILDMSNLGFHGSIWTTEGYVYIDPYSTGNNKAYIVYYTKDYKELDDLGTACGLAYSDIEAQVDSHRPLTSQNLRTENIPLRTYRLALACTGEYGRAFSNDENVLANMNTGVNRLNLIFINELSIKVELINDNDKLINRDPATDSYANATQGTSILTQNTNILNNKVGENSYDLGHVFTVRCTDVGGVAFLGSVCADNKGGGVTCVSNSNNISFTMVRITSHEMGHQFGASHTFNNCGGNESTGSAYEPGGGSTIMSYGGLCGPNSFIDTNDDYYHNFSLQQIFERTRNAANPCGSTMDIGNHAPVAIHDYKDGFYIPISTPFELTGDGTDEDGDIMTFSWEEMDKGTIVPLGQPIANSPLFRSFPPSPEKTRYLPQIDDVRYGKFDNAEVLPTYSRNLKFRFVVRDNHPGGGLVDWKQVDFKATASAGPFVVTYPTSSGYSYVVGGGLEVQWDVANTDIGLVNAAFVDILLSEDNGITFTKALALNVPNDGSQIVVLPNIISDVLRIKVKASDNIFYDMSNRPFEITAPTTGFYFELDRVYDEVCLPEQLSYDISTVAFGNFAEDIVFDLPEALPDGIVASFTNNTVAPNSSTSIELSLTSAMVNGFVTIPIRGISVDADTIYQYINLNLISNDFSMFGLTYPEDNKSGTERFLTFKWNAIEDASSYTFEIASSPKFENDNIYTESNITIDSFKFEILLDINTIYYWRVIAHNKCEDYSSRINVFATKTKSCRSYTASNLPKSISSTGTPTIEAVFDILSSSNVVDVNIKKIDVLHDNTKNLEGVIVSPSGTSVTLWSKKCANLSKVSCGFDDETTLKLKCPMVGGVFQPLESLSAFNGEKVDGQWKFLLKDLQSGSGGQFKEAIVEICIDETFNKPYLYKYEALGVKLKNENIIKNDFLYVKDDDNTNEELIFTIVSLPKYGDIRYGNTKMSVGGKFNQKDIDEWRISYKHNGDTETPDQFEYVVEDGAGGWIPKAVFEINIGDQYPDAVENIDLSLSYNIYPNPTNSNLFIQQISNKLMDFQYRIYDVNGKIRKEQFVRKNKIINLSLDNLSAGIYVLELIQGDQRLFKKISLIK